MTVGELKKQIENLPDDLQVITSVCDDGGGWDYFTDNVCCMVGSVEESDFIPESDFEEFKNAGGEKLEVNCVMIGQ